MKRISNFGFPARGYCSANTKISKKPALPFENVPGPSKLSLILGFSPGGKYHRKSILEFFNLCRSQYGDIFLVPGVFGKRNVLITYNPDDFERVYRTEGAWPLRRGLDIIEYYRKVRRTDVFQHAPGLVADQGEAWYNFRSSVNPAMMQPKTIKSYIPKMDKVASNYVKRIREIRDSTTHEAPADFEQEINNWALESIALIALDTELGLLEGRTDNLDARKLVDGMKIYFGNIFELDFQPSLWKILPTPKFRQVMRALDDVTELSIKYIDEAVRRLKDSPDSGKPENEKSVLERLVKIDRQVAIVMAMDMLLAGVDTTTTAFAACMLALSQAPDKQARLREEILRILPQKDSQLEANAINNLPYLRACIKESFRLYPVLAANFRSTGQEIVLSGYQIPKGLDVGMPIQVLMKDDTYYRRPNDFLPERWLKGGEAERDNANPFIFLPFGFGPRMCIGKRMTDLQLEIAVSKVIRNFRVSFDYPKEDVFKASFINVPHAPLRFKFDDV